MSGDGSFENAGPALVLRFDTESAAALTPPEARAEGDWPAWLAESLEAVQRLRRLLDETGVPASFFMVGELLRRAGEAYAAALGGSDGLDIGNHTDSHRSILGPEGPLAPDRFRAELRGAAVLIERLFGRRPEGFTAPGGHCRGLRGQPGLLRVLWEEGYRHITSDARPEPGRQRGTPAPMTQPYAYGEDGFPDLLELPLTGWHCNMLFNTGGQIRQWTPAPALPDGTVVERLARSPEEGFEIRRHEFEFAVERRLVYAPCMHPWSLLRADPELRHVRRLIELAQVRRVPVLNCRQLAAKLRAARGR